MSKNGGSNCTDGRGEDDDVEAADECTFEEQMCI